MEYTADANSAGTIKGSVDASVIVNNCCGFGIRANKIWSDSDFTTAHARIYTAVYLDDTMLNDKVRYIDYPNTTVQYFFDSMAQNKHLSNYGIYEVELINPVVDEKGNVKSYDSLRRLEKISSNPDDKKIPVDVADRMDKFTLHVRTCPHRDSCTSFRQILPVTALKILEGRQPVGGFLPCHRQNYA